MNDSLKKKVTKVLYIGLSLFFLVCIFGYEFFWRYDSKLDITIHAKLRDNYGTEKNIVITEHSESAVDTTRREYKDVKHGKTDIAITFEGSNDTIRTSMNGKYISEARTIHISSDPSSQLLLIPNTIQGLSSGSNQILYFKSDSLLLKEFSGFIADVDKDAMGHRTTVPWTSQIRFLA